MATVLRGPLVVNPYKRVWVSGVHDQGQYASQFALYTAPPPAATDQLRPPLIARNQGRVWLNGLHDQGCFGSTLYIPAAAVQAPLQNYEFPVPQARVSNIDLRTWISDYTAYLPVVAAQAPLKNTDFPVPSPRERSSDLWTWTNSNPNLYTVTPPASTDQPRPPLIARNQGRVWINGLHDQGSRGSTVYISEQEFVLRAPVISSPPERVWKDLHGWVYSSTSYIPVTLTPVPFHNPEFPAPKPRPSNIELRTWVYSNPNLYTSPKPVSLPALPVPEPRRVDIGLRTWVSSYTAYLPTPVVQPPLTNPVFPVPQSRVTDTGLRTWTYGSTPYLPVVAAQSPLTGTAFPVPPARAIDIGLRTWVSSYTPYLPVVAVQAPLQGTTFPVPSSRSIGIELKTWLNSNPNLYVSEEIVPRVPVFNPPFREPASIELRTWTYGSTAYIPTAPVQAPLRGTTFPVPESRRSDNTLRTWTYGSTAYLPITVQAPLRGTAFPVPESRRPDNTLRTWVQGTTIYNSYVQPPGPPPNPEWPTPIGRFHGPGQKTWVVPTNPNLFPPAVVIPAAGNDKQFIGEIQSLGIGSILDSSMGVT